MYLNLGVVAAEDTTEGEAVGEAVTVEVATAAGTGTGTACKRSRERRTDRQHHTFEGMHASLHSANRLQLYSSYLSLNAKSSSVPR